AGAGAVSSGCAAGFAAAPGLPHSRGDHVRHRGVGGAGAQERGRDLYVRRADDKRREPDARGLRGLSAERRRARGGLRRARDRHSRGGNRGGSCYSAGRVQVQEDRERGRSHLDEGL
ncbi:MAG: NADH-ubiquinone oxidoreductase chain K, partial [uncultured Rubrobacteraceae bacterium]